MAERKVKPKIKNSDGTYDELVINKSHCAMYASEDTSKGTIEERLTRLGFRESSISLESGLTAAYNVLTRQGNYVIGRLYFTNGASLNVIAYSNASTYTKNSIKIGSISAEYYPKQNREIGVTCSIKYDSNQNTQPEIYGYATVTITVDGDIILNLYAKNTTFTQSGFVNVMVTYDKPLMIDFGYEANPL